MTADGNGGGDLDPEAVEGRVEWRVRGRSPAARAVAKASAMRTLERFNRAKRQVPPTTSGSKYAAKLRDEIKSLRHELAEVEASA